jgi:hypothetical protein
MNDHRAEVMYLSARMKTYTNKNAYVNSGIHVLETITNVSLVGTSIYLTAETFPSGPHNAGILPIFQISQTGMCPANDFIIQ